MKTSFAILISLGFGLASASANQIAIFKRTETVAGTYTSEQLSPPAGLAPLKTSVKLESYEVIDLTTGERRVITKDLRNKKYTISLVENTIGYNVMKLKVAGTFLWYRGAGESGQAEGDYGAGIVPGFDYFPDATSTSPAGDNDPDYFSTWQYTQSESGKAAPVKLGAVTLTVPTTISILGDSAEQYEDTGAGDRGVVGSTVKGTVTLDKPLTTKANNDPGSGTLAYGVDLVRNALNAAGFSLLP